MNDIRCNRDASNSPEGTNQPFYTPRYSTFLARHLESVGNSKGELVFRNTQFSMKINMMILMIEFCNSFA